MTKSKAKTTSPENGDGGIGFETAVLASVSPLSIVTMGTFPLSLIVWGRMNRQHFFDSHSLETNKTPVDPTEELESAQQTSPSTGANRILNSVAEVRWPVSPVARTSNQPHRT